MNEHQASDLYITKGFAPTMRGSNGMMRIQEEPLTLEEITEIVNTVLTSRQKREFDNMKELNTALDMGAYGRFRVNIMKQRQAPALVIRRIVMDIPSFDALCLPPVLENLAMEKRGLILLTGMTGSGKSTTLAAMIDKRNETETGHIITIEDPIEYFHQHKKCIVSQREVGVDTESFSVAMKNSLRQRPDVILVGEVRDRDVMEQALSISETGHLCLATLHTNNSYQAIERMVNLFPEDYHRQVRLNLSMNLIAIVSQRLVPRKEGGLAPAVEIMLNQGLVRDLIVSGEIGKILDVMEQSNSLGMCSYDQSLIKLYEDGVISQETAVNFSDRPSDIQVKLQQRATSGVRGGDSSGGNSDVLRSIDTSSLSLSD